MERNGLINVSKRIMAGCLTVAMILTGIVVMPQNVEAATDIYFASSTEYKMSDYWNGRDNKAPVKEGYVFSGWYNAERTTPLKAADLTQADDTACAKFVPAEVLSIKTQKGTSTVEGKTITSLRILSTVDSKNYQAVGFYYKLATQNEGKTEDITKVYSKIRQSKDSDKFYEPEIFVPGVSKYFMAADVSSISNASFSKIVYARPYWITMDGTKVMGLARNSRVEDKDADKDYTSVGITLFPQLTEEKKLAAVAAGKIQVKYNTADYDVYSVDKVANNSEGGTYLFSEMECRIDDESGTITFVGNAVDVTKALTADGLFANVRFKNVSGNKDAALNFTINRAATDFCNWVEETVTEFVVQ